MSKREWFAHSLEANGKRIQTLIYENYLGAIPLTEDDFRQLAVIAINENVNATRFTRGEIGRANQLRALAETAQRVRRQRLLQRLVGAEAVRAEQAESAAVQRPVGYLYRNGDSGYHVSDEAGSILSDYIDSHGGDPELAADLDRSLEYLRTLPPKEMARLLAQANGLRKMAGQQVRINGKNHPVYRLKPKRVPGLQTTSRNSGSMRVMFVQIKQGGIGILEVVSRDRLDRFVAKH